MWRAPLQTSWPHYRQAGTTGPVFTDTAPCYPTDLQPQWAQHFPHASQDSAESLVCIPDPPGQCHHCRSVGTKIVHWDQCGPNATHWVGKGSSCPEKEAVSHEALASHSRESRGPVSRLSPSHGHKCCLDVDVAPVTLMSYRI